MARVAKFLAEKGSVASKELIETGVEGRATTVRDALDRLILGGFVPDSRPKPVRTESTGMTAKGASPPTL